jgi:hypothetical protein
VNGFGGFGYDTSHVKPDEQESGVVKAARVGDASQIQLILDQENDQDKRRTLINGARRWTEVDYRMSGFTKEYEWVWLDSACLCSE